MTEQSHGSQAWVPAFEGQRPPFVEGNTASLKHGARSPRKIEPLAEQFVEQLMADESVAFLHAPRFAAAVRAWATAEAKCALIANWVDSMTIEEAAESSAGRTSPLELLRRWEATAEKHRSRLGLDPVSAARLGKDVAQGRQADAAAMLTQAREEAERAAASRSPKDRGARPATKLNRGK